jgi:hypothetical protein
MLGIMPLSRYARVRNQADTVDCPRPIVEVIKYVVPGAHAATSRPPLGLGVVCVVWSVDWGTMIIDAWTRRGLMASDFFPFAGPRPGKWLVDAIISL